MKCPCCLPPCSSSVQSVQTVAIPRERCFCDSKVTKGIQRKRCCPPEGSILLVMVSKVPWQRRWKDTSHFHSNDSFGCDDCQLNNNAGAQWRTRKPNLVAMSKTHPATFLFSVLNSHIGYLSRTPNEAPLSNGLAIKIIKIVSVSVYKGSVIVWGFFLFIRFFCNWVLIPFWEFRREKLLSHIYWHVKITAY